MFEDPQLLRRVIANGGRLVDGAVVATDVEVGALVLVQLDHVLVVTELQVLEIIFDKDVVLNLIVGLFRPYFTMITM